MLSNHYAALFLLRSFPAVSIPVTGQRSTLIPVIIGIVALISAIICIVKSKKNEKKLYDNSDADYIREEQVEKDLTFFTSKKEDTFIEKPEEKEE